MYMSIKSERPILCKQHQKSIVNKSVQKKQTDVSHRQ